MKIKQLSLVVISMFLMGCSVLGNRVVGNGEIVSQDVEISDFSTLVLDGSGEVTLVQGDAPSLTITTDENLFEYLENRNRGETLRLSTRRNVMLSPSYGVHYLLTVPDLDDIQLNGAGDINADSLTVDALSIHTDGSGDIEIENLDAKTLSTTVNGAGSITVAGQVETQEGDIDGAGDLRLHDLQSDRAEISIDGAGSVEVWAVETLKININGAGDVAYVGQPEITQSINGSGDIYALDGQ